MLEMNEKQVPQPEVIAQPPLRLVPAHAQDDPVKNAVPAGAIKNNAHQSGTVREDVEPQVVIRLIQYFEKKS